MAPWIHLVLPHPRRLCNRKCQHPRLQRPLCDGFDVPPVMMATSVAAHGWAEGVVCLQCLSWIIDFAWETSAEAPWTTTKYIRLFRAAS